MIDRRSILKLFGAMGVFRSGTLGLNQADAQDMGLGKFIEPLAGQIVSTPVKAYDVFRGAITAGPPTKEVALGDIFSHYGWHFYKELQEKANKEMPREPFRILETCAMCLEYDFEDKVDSRPGWPIPTCDGCWGNIFERIAAKMPEILKWEAEHELQDAFGSRETATARRGR